MFQYSYSIFVSGMRGQRNPYWRMHVASSTHDKSADSERRANTSKHFHASVASLETYKLGDGA